MTRPIAAALACAGTVIGTALPQGTGTPTADDALRAAATYLAAYEKSLPGIVAEEEYVQSLEAKGLRRLRSDMLVILDPAAGWVGFRDVFEVDGKPVRDRDDRLQALFLAPNRDAVAQARRIVEEGSRFNLNPARGGVNRTINQPFLALKFLRRVNQPRSTFRLDGTRNSNAAAEVRLAFTETVKPRLIASPNDAPAIGSFWVNAATGTVAASELRIRTASTQATIRVRFEEHPSLKVWLPVRMDETYVASSMPIIEGRATYSNARQFKVETDTIIK